MTRTRISSLALLSIAAVPAAAALTGCGTTNSSAAQSKPTRTTTAAAKPSASAATVTGPVKVGLGEWKVSPSATAAGAGKVTFDVTNDGKTKHEFVVLRTSKPAGALGAGARVPETGNVGETGDIAAGAHKSVTIALKPGHYSFVCNLPGHYAAGMHADFTVK